MESHGKWLKIIFSENNKAINTSNEFDPVSSIYKDHLFGSTFIKRISVPI